MKIIKSEEEKGRFSIYAINLKFSIQKLQP